MPGVKHFNCGEIFLIILTSKGLDTTPKRDASEAIFINLSTCVLISSLNPKFIKSVFEKLVKTLTPSKLTLIFFATSFPRFETDGPVTRHLDTKGYKATTGIGEDLMQAARDAVSGMIDWVSQTTGMSALEAYILCSVCGDLRISEIVDIPNWTVSFYLPKSVLE